MRKRFLSVFVVAAIFLFVGGSTEAADIELGGQFRPRFEAQDRDFTNDTDPFFAIQSRVRLNTKVTVDDDISAFFQLQATPIWGADTLALTSGSDGNAIMGIHQAYVTLGNFFGLPVDLKVGRQEVIFDGHRIVGNTGWTAGAVRHDAIRLNHSGDNYSISYVYSDATEFGVESGAGGADDETDTAWHMLHASLKEVLGGKFSLMFIYTNDDAAQTAGLNNDYVTTGFRQAGNLMGLDYRVEFYYQAGDADICSDGNCFSTAAAAGGPSWDRSAYMVGARIGHKFSDFMMQPSLTLWYDYLSGDDDQSDTTASQFTTLLDTGHKFYGFMDRFLAIGLGNTGGSTQGLGLQDIAVKTSITPMEGTIFKADLHIFYTSKDVYTALTTQATTPLPAGQIGNSHLGQELDLTLIHKYSDSTKFVVGYSHFFASALMQDLGSRTAAGPHTEDADWGYVMLDFKF